MASGIFTRQSALAAGWQAWIGSVLAFSLACTGEVDSYSPLTEDDLAAAGPQGPNGPDGPDGPSGPAGSNPPPLEEQPVLKCDQGLAQASPSALRRLSPKEYLNSVSDLLGMEFLAELDETESTYATELGVRRFDEATQLLETQVLNNPILVECDLVGPDNRSCVETFIRDFGRRAFRRPVTEEEAASLETVYDNARTELDHASATLVVLRVMMQSPQFLYRVEIGEEDTSLPDGIRRLTGFERATRLSYFLLGTTPDAVLLNAAAAGELDTPEGVRSHATRIWELARARASFREVVTDWLHLDGATILPGLDETDKNADALGVELTPSLRAAMRDDVLSFAERAVFDGDGTFGALLTGTDGFVTPELADLYGVSGEGWVDLGPERAGILTRAAWLTIHASQRHKSPIRRGAYMIRNFLCLPLGNPPPDVDDTPLEAGDQGGGETLTIREATEAKTSGGTCQGCHRQINSLGYAFEHFDALGRWQETEEGKVIDASSEIIGTDVDGTVTGASEFMSRLVQSESAQSCFADRFLESALGRMVGTLDECSKNRIMESFATTGDVEGMLLDIVTSDSFLYLNGAAPAGGGE